jgi:hypothetical protein
MPLDQMIPATSGRRGLLQMKPLEGVPLNNISADPPPPAGTTRWVHTRKAAVVVAILTGRMTIEEACEMYGLSAEEILSWRNLVQKFGVDSLRVTSLQAYRRRS